MLVHSAMVNNPLTVSPETSLVEFVDLVLGSNQTTAAVLGDDGELLGMIAVGDILRAIVPHYLNMEAKLVDMMHEGHFDEKFAKFENVSVREVMLTKIDSLAPDDAVIKAVALFARKRRKSIPVVQDGKFIGMLTRRSLLRTVRHLPPS